MSNQFLQYFDEPHRNDWLADQHLRQEAEERQNEALQAQLACHPQVSNKMPPQNHGPFGLLKAAFSHLPGHKVAAVTH